MVDVPKIEPPKEVAPPPSSSVAPAPAAVAPPPADLPSFTFEGGKTVESSSDPAQIYKGLIESTLRFNWERPRDIDDHTNVAEVEISVDKDGDIGDPVWKKGSGQKQWDESVRVALASTKKINRPPPTNFPARVIVRFDVQAMAPVGQ